MINLKLTPSNSALIGAAVGAVLAWIFRVIYDQLKSPNLKYNKTSGPWIIGIEDPYEKDKYIGANAYRLRIENKKKFFANAAAENCICWVNFDGKEETFHMPWIGDGESVTINVDDYREIDFCARCIADGVTFKEGYIIGPFIKGYEKPILLGKSNHPITGLFRVTSSNGRKEEKRFTINPIEKNQVNIIIEKSIGGDKKERSVRQRVQDILIGAIFGLTLGLITNLWVSVFEHLYIETLTRKALFNVLIIYSVAMVAVGFFLWYYAIKMVK